MEASPVAKALRSVLGGLSRPVLGSDAELLERFVAQRDEAAFTALVQRHGPMVLRVCRRMLANPDDAEDAFQAAFVVLARRAAAIVKRPSLASWLHGVARHTSLHAQRSSSQRRAHEQSLDDTVEPCREHPLSAESDLRPILDEELSHLPERYRAPLVLCYLESRSVDEAAAELGVARGTVASRMSRGRDLLRSRLAKRGLALSAAALTAPLESTAIAAIPPATLQALLPAGFVSGAGIREGAALLAKEALRGMFWSKVRWVGILVVCLLTIGTGAAAVKWAIFNGKPEATANPTVADSPTAPSDDFYVRWSFENGPPKDIQEVNGAWRWGQGGGRSAMLPSAGGVIIELPTRIPKRPFVLSVKLGGYIEGNINRRPPAIGLVAAGWIDRKQASGPSIWNKKISVWKFTQPVHFYFSGRWQLVSVGTTEGRRTFIRALDYRVPYPSQRLYMVFGNVAIEEIDLRGLGPEEFPNELRHIEQTIKAMGVEPHYQRARFPSLK